MDNRIEKSILFLAVASASAADCESFIFIRIFSLSALLILLLYKMMGNLQVRNRHSLLFLIIFMVSFALTYLFSVNRYNVRLYFSEYAGYVALLFIVSSFKNREELIHILSYALITSSFIQVLYSVPQIIRNDPRIDGNTGYANFLGFHILLGFMSAVYNLRKTFKSKKVFYSILNCIISFSLMYMAFRTGSRNIILLMPFAVIYILWGIRKRGVMLTFAVIALILIALPKQPFIRMVNEAKTNPYGVQRVNIYKQTVKIALNNILIGIGRNNLPLYSLETNFPVEGQVARYGVHAEIAHNEYIEWIVGGGLPGIAMLIIFLFVFMHFLKIKIEENENKLYLIFIYILYSIYSMVDNSLYLPYNAVPFFIVSALMLFPNEKMKNGLLFTKTIIPLFVCLSLIMLIGDFIGYFISRNIVSERTNLTGNFGKDEKIYRRLLKKTYLCEFLTNNPKYFMSSYQISEKIFQSSGYVSDFYGALNALDNYMSTDRRNHNSYLEMARLLRRYSKTVLRKNNDIDDRIRYYYEKALKLNPFNPFIRSEYAGFLLLSGDSVSARDELKEAVNNEKNYLRAYDLLARIDPESLHFAALRQEASERIKNLIPHNEYDRLLIQ